MEVIANVTREFQTFTSVALKMSADKIELKVDRVNKDKDFEKVSSSTENNQRFLFKIKLSEWNTE